MKNKLSFLLIGFCIAAFFKINAQQLRFGVQSGVGMASAFNHFSKNNELKHSPELKPNNSPVLSYSANLYISYPFNEQFSVALEPGLIRKGFANQIHEGNDLLYNRNFLYYVQLPVLVEFKLDNPFTFSIGPELGYLLSAKLKEKHDADLIDLMHYYQKNRIAAGVQGGGYYSFSKNFDLGLKTGLSFTNLDKFILMDTEGHVVAEVRRKALYINAFTRYKF